MKKPSTLITNTNVTAKPKSENETEKNVKQEENKTPFEQKAYNLLKNNGMLDAYNYVLTNICKDGLPQGDIFEYASYMFGSYEKKWKQMKSKEVKEKIKKYKEEKNRLNSSKLSYNIFKV